ncbi:MAG: hypothetical protein ACR2MF_04085, partial [Chthoniobacterales bacterium]
MKKNLRRKSVAAMKEDMPSNVTVRFRDGEYRVNFKAGKEATAYYTNDANDAVATAWAMVEQDSRIRQGLGYDQNPLKARKALSAWHALQYSKGRLRRRPAQGAEPCRVFLGCKNE